MKIYSYIFLFLIASLCVEAQYRIDSPGELEDLKKVPLEKIYIHYSSPIVFPGEYLYFKLYTLNAQTNRLSRISSVAYVALVNTEGDKIFEQKIWLDRGMGTGDYFLTANIPSGAYKLIGYTQWMKNAGLDQLFQADIHVINPYLVVNKKTSGVHGSDSSGITTGEAPTEDPGSSSLPLALLTDTTHYQKRSPVRLSIRNFKGSLGYGQYSVLVRKRNEIGETKYISAAMFGTDYLSAKKIIPQKTGDSVFLPEQRGELLFGRVTDMNSGEVIADQEVILSLPGESFQLTATQTNSDGFFYTYLKNRYEVSKVIASAPGREDVRISIMKQQDLRSRHSQFINPRISEDATEAIVERSVHNQIENLFFSRKPDSTFASERRDPFDGGMVETYLLSDFTRFTTLEETLIELLNDVGYRRGKDGSEYIRIQQDFEFYDEQYNDYKALVMIDGVYIPDHSTIKTFDARMIREIKILRDPMQLGNRSFQGLIYFSTFEGDYYLKDSELPGTIADIQPPNRKKGYFRPNYEEHNWSNIPDYRYMLFWEPQVEIEGSRREFVFYTSDVPGEYELFLEGFTTYGKPISVRHTIQVVSD